MAEKIYFMERVEGLLKEKKLTQKELADDLGLRRPTLSDWKKNGAIPAGADCKAFGRDDEWRNPGVQ